MTSTNFQFRQLLIKKLQNMARDRGWNPRPIIIYDNSPLLETQKYDLIAEKYIHEMEYNRKEIFEI